MRTGLEDTTVLADGRQAADNAELVRAAAALISRSASQRARNPDCSRNSAWQLIPTSSSGRRRYARVDRGAGSARR
ncbi:MAG: 3-keto-5-aminohexanoate cleavage protein [Actinomycetota bacterium]|nr:3-keto-5-aminohexanoate cleavage protein [Actinomycetota bacterium]